MDNNRPKTTVTKKRRIQDNCNAKLTPEENAAVIRRLLNEACCYLLEIRDELRRS